MIALIAILLFLLLLTGLRIMFTVSGIYTLLAQCGSDANAIPLPGEPPVATQDDLDAIGNSLTALDQVLKTKAGLPQ